MKYLLYSFLPFLMFSGLKAQRTEVQYLSGTGSDKTVDWEFFCTSGMKAGNWTTIPVPSNWELQGFGKYDYGYAKDSVRGKEKGFYKYHFKVPASWSDKKINLVFEGVMTDAEVRINGHALGPVHKGAFYAFRYSINQWLNFSSDNLLEVDVAKHSSDPSVNEAERKGDYWIFGGIFRPVFLEAVPQDHIRKISLDAKHDGNFQALLDLEADHCNKVTVLVKDLKGNPVGPSVEVNLSQSFQFVSIKGKCANIHTWTAETPAVYQAEFTLWKNGKPVHTRSQRFGFRTIEVKQRDGIYVNGVKVKMKGVNRHTFWPTTGRASNWSRSLQDILEMKDMNMNAVRMSHYPPDGHFLDLCDSLGLYVMDELAGWHGQYSTSTGSKLVAEMLEHDSHHPSILFWSNGNEGGHNRELDTLFTQFDLQKRPVLHPWENFGGFDTQHYREYNYGIGNYENGRYIVMPTEFLHGQFDGGHGAGLEDYWEKMWQEPLQAGGFLWDFADNAVVRRDKHDSLDTDKHRAADGIMGPFHQKEGSYYTIKEVWSPVHFERKEIAPDWNGKLVVENRYHFTNLSSCRFYWELKRFEINSSQEKSGQASQLDLSPGAKGLLDLKLPNDWQHFDVLYVSVKDQSGHELFTWSFPIAQPALTAARMLVKEGDGEVNVIRGDTNLIFVSVKNVQLVFNESNGKLVFVKNAKGILPFNNGPVIQEGVDNIKGIRSYKQGREWVLESTFHQKESYNTLKWTIYPSGWVKLEVRYFPGSYFTNFAGINFSFPEKEIRSVTYMGDGPYRVWKNRMKGNRFGVWSKKYNATETGEAPWEYPEFKGYHSRFYGGYFYTQNNRFTVATETEGLFLRLFTPAWKTDAWHNYEPLFPSGDISFMQGISSIGSKTQRNETTGPMGGKNIYYDYEKDPARALSMTLYFNFE